MKGYVLGLLYMDNWDWYEKYLPETAKLIEEHGGKYLASGVKPDMKEGIDQPTAKKIVKLIKDAKMKVQTAIQGDKLRVTGKKRDDLQQVMQLVKGADLGQPFQFENFRD